MSVKELTLTMTEAERGFSELINRVRYRGESVLLTKNGRAVARITPTGSPLVTEAEWARGHSPVHDLPLEDAPLKNGLHAYKQAAVPWD